MEHEREEAKVRAVRNRSLRGMFLTILYRFKGKQTMMSTFEMAALQVDATASEARTQLEYLEEKGYIRRRGPEEQRIPGIGETYEITPAGTDLVEGTTEDPGVVF